MGSVKDLRILKPATASEEGIGVFYFTDDYSVFDYGKMPDTIPGKGEAICRVASYNFEELGKLGIRNHFRKMLSPKEMEINLVRVLKPEEHDLSKEHGNYLVPLEVIFRNSLPEGSSVFKRLESGQTTIEELGLEKMPVPGEKLEKPIVDFSTKLEERDRYMGLEEAVKLAGITDEQFAEIKNTALKINNFLTKKAEGLGLEHADGKVEFALNSKGEVMVVDVLGTLDENRFLYNGMHLSKQVLRDYYKTTDWPEKFEKEGKSAVPPKLPAELIELVSNMYKSFTEAWVGEKIWGAPAIADVVAEYKKFLEKG